MDLHPDWKELIELFNAHGVEFVVVGAYAVAFYTTPRSTADIDFVTRRSEQNSERVRKALAEFGVQMSDGEAAKLLLSNQMIQLGIAPYRVDILTSIDGVETEDLYARRVEGVLGGLPVSFPAKDDLIAAKKAANRPKDRDDIRRLTRKK
jgi:Nucleotidyl transferase of unknown function (DUF2204)